MALVTFFYSKGNDWGFYAQVIVAAGMAVFMGIRFFKSYKFMPAGMFCIVSLCFVTASIIIRLKVKKPSDSNI